MQCPECRSELANAATYCGCGWKKPIKTHDTDEPRAPCAHLACGRRATVRVKTRTGWANFCHTHYANYYTDEAQRYCDERDLKTVDKRREHAKAILRKNPMFANLEKLYQTEPGEDRDEEPF